MDPTDNKLKTLQDIKERLEKTNQQHLLTFYSLMENDVQEDFLKHLQSIDFERAVKLYKTAVESQETNQNSAGANQFSSGINQNSTGINLNSTGINLNSTGINLNSAGANPIGSGTNQNTSGENQFNSATNQNLRENQFSSETHLNSTDANQVSAETNQNSTEANQISTGTNQNSTWENQISSETNQNSTEENQISTESNQFSSETNLNSTDANQLSSEAHQFSAGMNPIPSNLCEGSEKIPKEILEKYENIGLENISENRVGVVLLAGGQGTRLGVTFPKGIYSVGLLSKKSLFQIQAERIKRLQEITYQKTGKQGVITWYIMTSEATERHTREYLEDHFYFGLKPKNVVIFEQGLWPCFDFRGKILLDDINRILYAPNGNGGLYEALKQNKIIEDMQKRGVKYIHVHSVDNILTKVADPVFIGYCIFKKAECGAKAVIKSDPDEPIGVICKVNNKYQVCEYSEISEEMSNLRDGNGDLIFKSGNICNHFFTVEFLIKIINLHLNDLKLHIAKKKICCLNEKGQKVTPVQPNGIKIEAFVFDVFQFAEKFAVWEVQRSEEFSAVKNSNDIGKDCPKTARRDLYALHKKYVEQNGGTVIGDAIEIDPLLSYAGENLQAICDGKTFECPVYITANEN